MRPVRQDNQEARPSTPPCTRQTVLKPVLEHVHIVMRGCNVSESPHPRTKTFEHDCRLVNIECGYAIRAHYYTSVIGDDAKVEKTRRL